MLEKALSPQRLGQSLEGQFPSPLWIVMGAIRFQP
jgi:hypothetical protein